MASKLQIITATYENEVIDCASNNTKWTSFLTVAAKNYKYSFQDQVLIYAQRPDATACAEIGLWNERFNRWVNKGAKGIALLDNRGDTSRLRYVFDVSDTNSRTNEVVPMWTVQDRFQNEIVDNLEASFGEIEDKSSFSESLRSVANNLVEDNFADYLSNLMEMKKDSFLEELDEDAISFIFKFVLKCSVAYMMMARCGIDVDNEFEFEDFQLIHNFNTQDVISILGTASSDIAEMGIREIESTVKNLQLSEKKANRTFVKANENEYDEGAITNSNAERSDNYEVENHLHTEGRLSDSEPDTSETGEISSIGQVRQNEEIIPDESSESIVHDLFNEQHPVETSSRDRQSGERDVREADERDGTATGSDGGTQSTEPDVVGSENDEYSELSDRDSAQRVDLQLSNHDFDKPGGLPYYYGPAEKSELLHNCEELRNNRLEIATFFAEHEDRNERGNFIKSFFDGESHEMTLESGQTVGYSAYDDVLHIWRGNYENLEKEDYMHWWRVAGNISSQILLREWLTADDVPFPTQEQQMQFIADKSSDKGNFVLPQEAIDYILTRGSSVHEGKYRIYEQFMKKEGREANVAFLKNEYGTGGSSDALPESGFGENHDSKGIEIAYSYQGQPGYRAYLIKWTEAEKRIGELIAVDRFLNSAEKENYPAFRQKREIARERHNIADEFKSIVDDFIDFEKQLGNDTEIINRYAAIDCARQFSVGFKKTYMVSDIFVVPFMRETMSKIIAENTHLTERCQNMLTLLSGDIAKELEPSADELNPPPPPKKEYVFSLGDTVHIGIDEYDILAIDNDEVRLFDNEFPLFNKVMTRTEFDEKIKENPLNDKFLKVIETANEEHQPEEQIEKTLYDEYLEVKAENPDAILMYQVGDFFEVMGEDAPKVAETLDVVLTHRNDKGQSVPLIGIPSNQSKTYLNMLLDRGFDVALSAIEADGTRNTALVSSVNKEDPHNTFPVGRIDYLSSSGNVRESIEYTSEYQFVKDIKEENHYGIPISIVFYKDKDGNTIPRDFINSLDPQPQGVEVIDSPYSVKSDFERIAEAILDFYDENFPEEENEVNVDNLNKIPLVYSTTGDTGKEIEVCFNYPSLSIDFFVDFNQVHSIKCESVDDAVGKLGNLTFDEIVAIAEEHEPEEPAEEKNEITEPESEITLDPPVSAPKTVRHNKVAPTVLYPEIKDAERNQFVIPMDLYQGESKKQRFRNNMEAINTLQNIEFEGRLATPDEQAVLAKYVGWGGLSEAFDENNSSWANEFTELYETLSSDEYEAARSSSLTAFYTPPEVIHAMYEALGNLGFKTGNILEPSCGVGNFIGSLPEAMDNSKIYGVELDSISGRIAQQLYQKSSIAVQGFEETNLPDSFFDCAIGNVPFGEYKIPDRKYDKYNFLIHDYFFARTIDKVRPGGIVAFITSKGTLDKENPSVRKYIAQRCDLLGAIRLPSDTFKKNAGTEVTSDIIFLQKRDRMIDIEPDWVHLSTDDNGIKMNSYFVDNPDMIMGEMKLISGPYGPTPSCEPYEGTELSTLLEDAIQNIHGEISEYEMDDISEDGIDDSIPADPNVKNFSYTVVDGSIYYRENSRMSPVDVSATAQSRIKGLIGIRDCVRNLIELQTEDYPDAEIQAEQAKLNQLYDDFSKKYGLINSRANNSAFSSDNSYCLLSSLEVLDDDGNFVRKADMFSKRTIKQKVIVQSVDTASEALALSLAEKTKVDMPYMESLTGKSEQEIFEDLRGVIFLNPLHTYENDGHEKYLPADEYLSGNVREKLILAKRTAELYPDDYAPNVTALEGVQPKDLTASEISVRLGATWLPTDVVEQFMFELFSTPRYCQWNIHCNFAKYTGEWNIDGKSYDRGNVKANTTYGTSRINGYKIIEQTLNLKDVRIFDYIEDENGNKKAVLNKKETAIAQGKQELIKEAFANWIWQDPERRERLCKMYNEKFNSVRPREYDGDHLNFVGMNPEISLRKHQVDAIAHIIYGGNTLLAHEVGAGKSATRS